MLVQGGPAKRKGLGQLVTGRLGPEHLRTIEHFGDRGEHSGGKGRGQGRSTIALGPTRAGGGRNSGGKCTPLNNRLVGLEWDEGGSGKLAVDQRGVGNWVVVFVLEDGVFLLRGLEPLELDNGAIEGRIKRVDRLQWWWQGAGNDTMGLGDDRTGA